MNIGSNLVKFQAKAIVLFSMALLLPNSTFGISVKNCAKLYGSEIPFRIHEKLQERSLKASYALEPSHKVKSIPKSPQGRIQGELAHAGVLVTKRNAAQIMKKLDPSQDYIYLIARSGEVYISPRFVNNALGDFQGIATHRSLAAKFKIKSGREIDVVGAGEINFGMVNNKSGTYRGSKQNLQHAINLLTKLHLPKHPANRRGGKDYSSYSERSQKELVHSTVEKNAKYFTQIQKKNFVAQARSLGRFITLFTRKFPHPINLGKYDSEKFSKLIYSAFDDPNATKQEVEIAEKMMIFVHTIAEAQGDDISFAIAALDDRFDVLEIFANFEQHLRNQIGKDYQLLNLAEIDHIFRGTGLP